MLATKSEIDPLALALFAGTQFVCMEQKIATPADALGVWNEMENPTCRSVQETLIARGYVVPSFKTISVWKKKWEEPKRKPPADEDKPKRKRTGIVKPHATALTTVARHLTGKPEPSSADIVAALTGEEPPPTEAGQAANAHFQGTLDRLQACSSDEALIANTAREAHLTATILFGAIAAMGKAATTPADIALTARAFSDVSSGLEPAGVPLNTVTALRNTVMVTINNRAGAEILPPGEDTYDPIDEALAAVSRDAA